MKFSDRGFEFEELTERSMVGTSWSGLIIALLRVLFALLRVLFVFLIHCIAARRRLLCACCLALLLFNHHE